MQLVAAEAEQQQDPLVDQAAGEEGDECPRRAVGPVHVLEHQYERLAKAQQMQELEQTLEQPHLTIGAGAGGVRWRCAETRQQGREVRAAGGAECVECRVAFPHQRPQRTEQRRVWKLKLALLETLAAQQQRPGEGSLGLEKQPRLPHAGVARHEDQTRALVKRFAERNLQLGQLTLPAHEATACQPAGHS